MKSLYFILAEVILDNGTTSLVYDVFEFNNPTIDLDGFKVFIEDCCNSIRENIKKHNQNSILRLTPKEISKVS